MSIPLFKQQQIQTITNDNGTAIKFPDGTMICYCNKKFTTGSTYGEIQWKFPVRFANSSYGISILGSIKPNYSPQIFGENNKGSDFIEFIVYKYGKTETLLNMEVTVSLMAIGRWK